MAVVILHTGPPVTADVSIHACVTQASRDKEGPA